MGISGKSLGLTSLYWPGTASNQPTVQYGSVRSFNWNKNYFATGNVGSAGCFGVMQWCNIETSAGVFDWTDTDYFLAANAGRDVVVNLMGTPSFYVASPVGNGAIWSKANNYIPGSNMPPDDLAKWTTWCTTLATRYGSSIIYELWNEPAFVGGSSGFWIGTAAKLAEMSRLAYQAIKAVAPTATILSPAFINTTAMSQFMTASDGAGGTGSQWFDVLAFHFYNDNAVLQVERNIGHVQSCRTALAQAGRPNVPIWNTESGPISAPMVSFTVAQRRLYLRKWMASQFALGVARTFYFCADNDWGLKSPADTGANWDMSAAWQEMYAEVVGKTIVSANIAPNGLSLSDWRITLTFSDGNTFLT